ncbi:hypothetical protein SCHPADRAFT_898309 [Schizopora paradoxa]|uniref:Uncharacterized protein n=1 Tax=Schizopora paradoxa TaxID=27342 RepID=A0A0H2S7P6_9AGAM|nr:hypothetical protein SCHPADRAFT_898309 [Schizopora paradoxa]
MASSSPTPLLPADVAPILARLNPLEDIPPTLLSTPLRQRHHFLAISPYDSDPAAYLAWPPSSAQEKDALDALLAALPGAEDLDYLQTFPTVYTHDGETTYAHASVPVHDFSGAATKGLRLVFRWEGVLGAEDASEELGQDQHPWKYHDAKPLPFPSGASPSPTVSNTSSCPISPISPASCSSENSLPTQDGSSALDRNAIRIPLLSLSDPSTVTQSTFLPVQDDPESEDDDYWNSYGRGSDEEEEGSSRPQRDLDDEKAEDAYWARYNSVQGTADSTIPSPVSSKHKVLEPSTLTYPPAIDAYASDPQEFDPNSEYASRADYLARLFMMQREAEQLGPHDLSPHALELRLHSISPRLPPPSSSELVSFATTPAPDANFGTHSSIESTEGERISSPDDVASFGSNESLTLSPPSTESQRLQRENILANETGVHSPQPRRSHEQLISVLDRENSSSLGLQLGRDEMPMDGCGEISTNPGVDGIGKRSADPSDAAVRDALKGVYRLWSATNQVGSQKEAFVDIVRDVLAGL